MSNQTVTYHQAQATPAAVGAVTPLVRLAGEPVGWLESLEVTRFTGARLHQARFRIHREEFTSQGRFDDLATAVRPGVSVQVLWRYYDGRRFTQDVWPLFDGVICGGSGSLNDENDTSVLEACAPAALGGDRRIGGVHIRAADGGSAFLPGHSAVFNPNGHPNAGGSSISGGVKPLFELSQRRATAWTYATAIAYLVREYLQPYDLCSDASWAVLETLTTGRVLRSVNVTGLAPLEAIERLCGRVAVGFTLELAPLSNGQTASCLRFFRDGRGHRAHLSYQKPGEELDLQQTNLQQISLKRQAEHSFHVVGAGGYKRFEATFELVGAWDASKEENNYDLYSPTTNPNFIDVKDVFRKWTLNESGDYSEPPYSRGAAYDFGTVFQTASYAARRRRFWPCLSRTGAGESMGYYLEVSYNSGLEWHKYPGAFDNLLDECGIYLTFDSFTPEMWIAIKKDSLAFRITATVVSDERLTAEVHHGPIKASRPVCSATSHLGDHYRYQRVTPASIFYGLNGLGTPDVVDDTLMMRARLRDHLAQLQQNTWKGSVTLPFIRPDLQPGQIINRIDGREINWRESYNETTGPQIRKVTLKFGRHWCTQLELGGELPC